MTGNNQQGQQQKTPSAVVSWIGSLVSCGWSYSGGYSAEWMVVHRVRRQGFMVFAGPLTVGLLNVNVPRGNVCGAAARRSDKWDSIYMTQWFVRRASGCQEGATGGHPSSQHFCVLQSPPYLRRWSVGNHRMKLLSASCCHVRHLVWDWLPICDQDLDSEMPLWEILQQSSQFTRGLAFIRHKQPEHPGE